MKKSDTFRVEKVNTAHWRAKGKDNVGPSPKRGLMKTWPKREEKKKKRGGRGGQSVDAVHGLTTPETVPHARSAEEEKEMGRRRRRWGTKTITETVRQKTGHRTQRGLGLRHGPPTGCIERLSAGVANNGLGRRVNHGGVVDWRELARNHLQLVLAEDGAHDAANLYLRKAETNATMTTGAERHPLELSTCNTMAT